MQFFALIVACAAVSPIEKTIELLESLQAKIVKEGEAEAKLYEEFTSFCNDESKETQFEIKTAKADVERAEAAIADETAKIGVAETKIEELSTSPPASSIFVPIFIGISRNFVELMKSLIFKSHLRLQFQFCIPPMKI